MKRLFFLLALMASLVSFSSYATDKKVSAVVLQSFNNSFKNATEVDWTAGENFYKANFNLNGQFLTAFFDNDGTFMAVTRQISPVQLPINLQASLKKHQEGLWITSLFEVASERGTTYYITLEDADNRIVYKATSSTWSVYQKQSKS
jgi:hypothetical protein